MYCGKVLPHIYQTPYPALYVAVMTSHCSKCPAGPCYDALTSFGGKRKALSSLAKTRSPETTPELLAGGSKP